MATKVIMPQLGESVVEGTVSRWLKQPGELVAEFESLLEVNTDKVDSEIPSPAAGTLLEILVPEGTTVKAGTLLAMIGDPAEGPAGQAGPTGQQQPQVSAERAPADLAAPSEQPAQAAPRTYAPGRDQQLGFVSPVVARMAREHNLNLSVIQGSGQGGRITKKDVLAFLESSQQAAAAQPQSEAAPWETPGEGDLFRPTEMVFKNNLQKTGDGQGAVRATPTTPQPAQSAETARAAETLPPGQPIPGRLVRLNTMRRAIADHMQHSVRTSPHVTTVMEADLGRVQAHMAANRPRFEQEGLRLTYTAYFASAAVRALQAHPLVNASWTDDGILLHDSVNLGIAVSLGSEGLIVPVIKNAGDLSLSGLARAVQDLAGRARSGRLQPGEVRDGTFTITNHGITGSLFATPIINQPQCAILGVGAVQKRVVVTADDAIAVRPMVYLSLTFDHRILDGASGDGFLADVVKNLESWA
jgi:2-oxoglutarate dehydrogenase E2 component (dihydrolipoamide succinyltransferase)